MLFKYRALNSEGRLIKDYIWAGEEQKAIAQLHALHIDLIKIDRVIRVKRLLTSSELIDFLLYLTWMLRAGVALREAIEALSVSLKNAKLSHVARQLIGYLDQGLFLSEAMALLPNVFTPLALYYVVVAEKGGDLAEQLALLTTALKEEAKWRSQLFNALAYPLLALNIALGAFIYLMVEVVPILVELSTFQNENVLATSMFLSHWLQTYGMEVFCLGCILISMGMMGIKLFPAWRTKSHTYLLRLPLWGTLVRDMALARMVEVMAHLHTAGLTLLDALSTVQNLTHNEAIRQALLNVIHAMEQGNTLAESFSQKSIFPSILIRALYLAEKSGQVAVSLEHAAQFFRMQIVSRLKKIQLLLGPLCLLIVGGILFAIVLLIFAPLFDALGQVY